MLKNLKNLNIFSLGLSSTSIEDYFKLFIEFLNDKSYLNNLKDLYLGITKTNLSKEIFEEFKKFILNQSKIDIFNIKMYWLKNIEMQEITKFIKEEAKVHKNKELHINMGKIMQAN